MNNVLISIIVPVYNARVYIERCVNSLLAQVYQNIEIILVDDGSTDGSGLICDELASKYSNIRVIHQANAGASLARKKGIEQAKGEYLMFADSDDYVSANYVSALYSALRKYGTDIALCPVQRIEVGSTPDFQTDTESVLLSQKELLRRFFKYEFWGYPAACYKRELFDNINFPTATVNEDYYVKAQMLILKESVAYVCASQYCYEQHPGSLSKRPLSLVSLSEFDNAEATWLFIKKHLPEYRSHALAIAAEAASKWLIALLHYKSGNIVDTDFESYFNRIISFLKRNFFDIMLDCRLLWKIKVVIMLNMCKSVKYTK